MLQLQTSQHTAKLTSCEWWVREPGDGWCVCNELHNCRRATAISKTFSSQSTSAYHRRSVQVPLTASWAGLQMQGAVFVMLYLPLHPLASACGATCLVLTAASWSGTVTLHFYCQSEWWDLPIDCTWARQKESGCVCWLCRKLAGKPHAKTAELYWPPTRLDQSRG